MKLEHNIVDDTDAYKQTHHIVYPEGLTRMYSYGESRGGRFDHVVFFGLKMIIMDNLVGQVVTKEKIDYAKKQCIARFGTDKYFNQKMWDYILHIHHGYLPLRIKAVPEGTRVGTGNVLFTVEATDPNCVALVQPVETLLMHIWYPTTIATNAYEVKQIVASALRTSGTPELIDFMVNDFGFRGTTCEQQAARGGSAFLTSFRGSDTNIGDRAAQFYYGYKGDTILKSVLATEHSVACLYGSGIGELTYLKRVMEVLPDNCIASVVMDTHDTYNFASEVAGNIAMVEEVKASHEQRGTKLVLRPDSGNPIEVTLKLLEILAVKYGYSFNSKHYKVLHPSIGLIWGDGLEIETIKSLYEALLVNGWSADNLVIGFGGGLLQKVNRDDQKFAIKASFAEMEDGTVKFLQKKPKTDMGKASKAGELKLHPVGTNKFTTFSSANMPQVQFNSYVDVMETVFENGKYLGTDTFDQIRQRVG